MNCFSHKDVSFVSAREVSNSIFLFCFNSLLQKSLHSVTLFGVEHLEQGSFSCSTLIHPELLKHEKNALINICAVQCMGSC